MGHDPTLDPEPDDLAALRLRVARLEGQLLAHQAMFGVMFASLSENFSNGDVAEVRRLADKGALDGPIFAKLPKVESDAAIKSAKGSALFFAIALEGCIAIDEED
ncbi:hypothetical protein EON81_21225 [bacterium]|nr:MAG: hypothetical protein EON81_21225 [bacterium]